MLRVSLVLVGMGMLQLGVSLLLLAYEELAA